MFHVEQFRKWIVEPALEYIGLYSADAVELLVFTCAVESAGGTYLKQIKGPALGIYQMELETYNDLWQNYITENSSLLTRLVTNFHCTRVPDEERLIYDLRYASAMTRIFYARIPSPLPSHTDLNAIWKYYKQHYNTKEGKATAASSIQAYQTFISS